MEKDRLVPERYRFLSNSALKLIALICMLLDHTAGALLYDDVGVLFTVFGKMIGWYEIFRTLGRLAFPIYGFLLVEGFHHTRDRKRYGIRLLLFALISEIPWNLEHTGTLCYSNQNVFFTLLLGYLGLCAAERLKADGDRRPWGALLLCLLALSFVLHADYGGYGFGFILLMDLLRDRSVLRAVAGACSLPGQWRSGLAFVPIAFYNGRRGFIRGTVLQLLFYGAYPAHLLLLFFIKRSMGGY